MIHGKKITHVIFDEMMPVETTIVWISAEGRCALTARTRMMPRGWEFGVTDRDMEQVQVWCEEHNCGKRTSFDTFRFRNRKEITMFLLRWS